MSRLSKRRRGPLTGVVLTGVLASAGAIASADAQAPRLAQPGCEIYTVVSGDTMTAIARNVGVPLEQLIERNRQVPNPNMIYVGDTLCVRLKPTPTTTQAPPSTSAEMMTKAPSVNVSALVAEGTTMGSFRDGCGQPHALSAHYDDSAVLALLWKYGARGNMLLNLAAVVGGESAGWAENVGDCKLETDKWGPSVGLWMIRTRRDQTSKQTPKDIDHVSTPDGNAWAAIEHYAAALAAGADPMSPWSAYTVPSARVGFDERLAKITDLARSLGMLDGAQ